MDKVANVLESSSGIKSEKALNFNMDNQLMWRDPPISPLGYIWPTDETYHPLFKGSSYEIASNLVSIEGEKSMSDEEKNIYKNKVQQVVINAPYIKAMGNVYIFAILIVITIILIVIFRSNIFIIAGVVLAVGLIYNLIYAFTMASGAGYNRWADFMNRYNAHSASGSTVDEILNKFREDEDRENNRRVLAASNSSRSGSFIGSLTGSLIGSSIRRR